MSVSRSIALVVGVVAALAGLAFTVQPDLVAGIEASDVVVTMLGAAGLVYGGYTLALRRRTDLRQSADPVPEAVPAGDRPGDDVDELLALAGRTGPGGANYRRRLRRRLEAAAVAAIRRHEDCSETEARGRLEDGTWTDDPAAASYFTSGRVALGGDVPLRAAAPLRLSRARREAHAARRAVAAIAALTGTEGEQP